MCVWSWEVGWEDFERIGNGSRNRWMEERWLVETVRKRISGWGLVYGGSVHRCCIHVSVRMIRSLTLHYGGLEIFVGLSSGCGESWGVFLVHLITKVLLVHFVEVLLVSESVM